jgi:hypothetical protein
MDGVNFNQIIVVDFMHYIAKCVYGNDRQQDLLVGVEGNLESDRSIASVWKLNYPS